ncbi:MAG TPA: 1,4-dihydroxy-2-naphthoate octaprenyltransferase [Ignavibacteria bacterium]|nr:1,4-dihydroxy-2-naphthoate octaprenyltransferase [Ignavibacteria bacterium]HAX47856.1 1,4-dihydroxy-2-naphthoate octaprenyltransferase [Bacteroidota bacterium]HRE11487.1 1,4-dihydroxy-2-naphthoate octaprenyltransferase [Ignavibacteria bacterium]HRF66359.1 1,4-dihydroxy-2-naphthoate octaprenyltransferase [Ignavibacteria bacterium]HRJ04337.1 1,4-dihydroxy-2-naphthoate octaprenyltransferase [Ignavibacteria bacterium]
MSEAQNASKTSSKTDQPSKPASKGAIYFQAVRAFSFPASLIPCLLGAMLALLQGGSVSWYLMPFIAISLLFLHAGSNVISDVDDYKHGVDAKDTLGGSRVLPEGLLSSKEMFRFGMILFGLAVLFGLPIIFDRGMMVLWLGIIGIVGGFFYTGRPIGYKYIALGDIFIFLLYGPAIVTGTLYALTGVFSLSAALISIPLGLLVTGILQANNLRDIINDRKANIKTLATVFGEGFAKGEYVFLIVGAYLTVILLVVFNVLSVWSLLVFLSLPVALKNMNMIKGVKIEDTGKIAMLDAMTAQLTLMFGVLLSISIIITKLVG